MRKTLTDRGVVALKPRPTRYHFPDPQMTGHYVRVLPSGSKTFAWSPAIRTEHKSGPRSAARCAENRGKPRIGAPIIRRIKAGLPPLESPPVPPHSFKGLPKTGYASRRKKQIADASRNRARS